MEKLAPRSRKELEKRKQQMEIQLSLIEEEQKRLEENSVNTLQTIEAWQEDSIKLNVGGRIFETTLATLRRFPGTLFEEIFEVVDKNQLFMRDDGTLFLDRCPEYFNFILNRLRNPESPPIEPEDEIGRKMLNLELRFYKMPQLKDSQE